MITPPTAGKSIRETCQSIELRATALIMSSRGMRLGKNAWWLGKSKPATKAIDPAMASTCHTATTPLPSSRASTARRLAMVVDVTMISLRRSTLSAMTPPASAAAMVGMEEAAPRNPSCRGDPLSSNTSHPCPMISNWYAPTEAVAPSQYRRNGAMRSAPKRTPRSIDSRLIEDSTRWHRGASALHAKAAASRRVVPTKQSC